MKSKITLSFLILLTSCNSTYTKDKHLNIKNNDTVFTVIAYSFAWNQNDHRITTAKKYYRDTFELKITDSSGGKTVTEKVPLFDSFYKVPLSIPKLDSTGKKVSMDTAGKPIYTIQWENLPKELLLIDYNKKFK